MAFETVPSPVLLTANIADLFRGNFHDLSVPDAVKSGAWPVIAPDFSTPIESDPSMPLSMLEKRWLKALLQDPRIALFGVSAEGLEDVEPLYDNSVIVYFDRYLDGDPYGDPAYIANFREALKAVREKRRLLVSYTSGKGRRYVRKAVPLDIEYSPKDDKFRLTVLSADGRFSINMARIERCTAMWDYDDEYFKERELRRGELVFELMDVRNALERAMIAFSDLEKVTERSSDRIYRVTLRYSIEDETEILIRILSFGPMIRVISPESFIDKIRERLMKQAALDREREASEISDAVSGTGLSGGSQP